MIDLREQTILISGADDALAHGIAQSLRTAGAAITHDVSAPVDHAVIMPSFGHVGDVAHTDPAVWDEALARNYEDVVFAMQTIAQGMIARGLGGTITVIVGAAALTPMLGLAVEGVTFTALRPAVKMAAVACAPHNIRVNMIAAGVMAGAEPPLYADRAQVVNDIPLGRAAQPADIGAVCCFLASPLAGYITGALIPVDGGFALTRAAEPLTPHMSHE